MTNDKKITVYLDESGDLGWRFDKPYRKGGSSRCLTISAIIVPEHKSYLPSRVIKKLYRKFAWDPKKEQKWGLMNEAQKDDFSKKCVEFVQKHNDISCHSITVYKPKVQPHIRKDANKLYNYMIGLMLIEELAKFEVVNFIPDPRSIKVQSGNSLSDYIQTKLWFEKNVSTMFRSNPIDSANCKGVQFVDMLSGIVQQHFEDQCSPRFDLIEKNTTIKKLYFS